MATERAAVGTMLSDAFVGREDVMRVLDAALDDAIAGAGRLVLLAGEAGMGKTRTAEQLAAHARERGVKVVWGRCYEGEGAPAFWPWMEVLRAAAQLLEPGRLADVARSSPELVHLLPGLRSSVPELPEPAVSESVEVRFRLFDAVASLVAQLAQSTPLVILVDDLHGADRSSLLLLEFVSRALRQVRALILATYRDVGVRSDHGLGSSLAELAREPNTQRLELRGLNRNEVGDWLRASATSASEDLVAQLYERTEGNPLFVGEFLRALAAERHLEALPAGGSSLGVPQSVRLMIERRMAPLSRNCRDALCFAAVMGREFDSPILLQATLQEPEEAPTDRVDVEAALEEAEHNSIIGRMAAAPGRWRFAHALIRETLYDALRLSERVRKHRLVGDAIEQRPGANNHLSELAHHFYEAARNDVPGRADDARKAIAYAGRAAQRAMELQAYEEAIRLLQIALFELERLGGAGSPDSCRLLVDLGIAQRAAAEVEQSKCTLLRAAQLAERLGLREELGRAALHYGTTIHWGNELVADRTLLQLLEAAIAARGDGDDPMQARLLARLSSALRWAAEDERRRLASERALEMARRLDDPTLTAETLEMWMLAHWEPEAMDGRLACSHEMVRCAEMASDRMLLSIALGHRIFYLIAIGDWSGAGLDRGRWGRVLERRDPLHRWWHDLFGAASLIGEGHFTEGSSLTQECLALEQQLNAGPPLGFFAVMFALWCAQGQRYAFEGLAGTLRAPAAHVARSVHQCMVAYVARELEREADARAEFEQLAGNDFADIRRDESWTMCMHELAEVCAFLGDVERAEVLIGILTPYENRMVTGMAGTIFGPVSHDLALLETTLLRWERAARHFELALEMNIRMHARPWLARTQYEYARMLLARAEDGDPARARALLDEALATARELEMPMLEERVLGVGSQVSVSPPAAQHPTPDSVFRREGQFWTAAYAERVVRLKDSKGVQYLAHLLCHPNQEVLALDLIQGADVRAQASAQIREPGTENPGPGTRDPGLTLLDAQAKYEYRQRWRELREELAEAEQLNDLGRVEKLKEEIDFLARQLNAAVDLYGKDRKVGAAAERARLMVTKRVKSVLKTLDTLHPSLAHHLRACVKTGYYCTYAPPPGDPVVWQT